MSINFDVQILWSWFKHQDLRHKGTKFGQHPLKGNIFYTAIIKRLLVKGSKYT